MPDLRFERIKLQSGITLYAARAGSGPLVVMLHGFPECWYSWRHQIEALSPRFECVAPNLRGYGDSDAPIGLENYTLGKLVGDVVDLIHACGRERAVIVAHDWGGGIAWATVLQRPEVVERLVVMNCPHLKKFQENLRRNPRQILRSWYMLFFQIPWLPESIIRANDFAVLKRMLRDSAVQKSAFSEDDLEHFSAAFKNPYSLTAALNYYRATLRSQLSDRIHGGGESERWIDRKISAPTMVIWGEQDIALEKESTYGMEDLFEGPFEIHYIPDSGHWVQQEKPLLVNQYLEKFLEPLASGPA